MHYHDIAHTKPGDHLQRISVRHDDRAEASEHAVPTLRSFWAHPLEARGAELRAGLRPEHGQEARGPERHRVGVDLGRPGHGPIVPPHARPRYQITRTHAWTDSGVNQFRQVATKINGRPRGERHPSPRPPLQQRRGSLGSRGSLFAILSRTRRGAQERGRRAATWLPRLTRLPAPLTGNAVSGKSGKYGESVRGRERACRRVGHQPEGGEARRGRWPIPGRTEGPERGQPSAVARGRRGRPRALSGPSCARGVGSRPSDAPPGR